MTADGADGLIFVFDTTNAVLWAEEIARQGGIPVEVVPAPAGSEAKCELALACRADDAHGLVAALVKACVPFGRWPPTD